MPFTAFHIGPGLGIKALFGSRVSLVSFGISQVVMDIEPLLGMMTGAETLHGWTHTAYGASGIAVVSTIIAGLCGSPFFAKIRKECTFVGLANIAAEVPAGIPLRANISGAFLGAFSHILLDGIMHHDASPFSPFTENNPLYGMLSIENLQASCIVIGIAGLIGTAIKTIKRKNV